MRTPAGGRIGQAVLPSALVLLALAFTPAEAAQWTVGVYMCADNGMNDLAYLDMAELQDIGSTSEVNIVVQVDNAARDSNPTCRRYRINKDGRTLIADLGEQDMADTTTLIEFCAFLKSRYAADNYMLVLWDHGNGWYPAEVRTSSIFLDESHQAHVMGVAGGELGAALRGCKRKLGKNIRVVAFDACMMGMLEVAEESRQSCDYLLASEGLVPNTGFPYDEVAGLLVARPTSTPAEFLPEMCRKYVAAYPGEDVCLSALDLRQLDRVMPVLRATVADSISPEGPGFAAARKGVQTFAMTEQRPPAPSDDHVDLIDFWALAPGGNTGSLRQTLNPLVVANERQGAYEGARGVAAWFPDKYLELKYWQRSYDALALSDSCDWLGFLNRFHARDEVRPDQPDTLSYRLSGNDLRLWWGSSWDVAPVRYDCYEAAGTEDEFIDYCSDLSCWSAVGWTAVEAPAHSTPRSFFSGAGPNLDNQLVKVAPIALPAGGLLSFYAYFQTEETQDTTGIHRDPCYVEWSLDRANWHALDSLYGSKMEWHERRYVLPEAGAGLYLRFRYRTDAGTNGLGVYIDDIRVQSFSSLRRVAELTPDSTCNVYNPGRDTVGYDYFVTATDSFGNVSFASQFCRVEVKRYAEPYTRPAPFNGPCELVIDCPAAELHQVKVRIYTLSGTLVKTFEPDGFPTRVYYWNGKNEEGRELADGLYIVSVHTPSLKRLGKIAKVTAPPESR